MNKIKIWTGLTLALTIVILSYLSGCQPHSIEKAQYITNGQAVYRTHCQNCHGAQGEGLGKLYPPLNDAAFFSKHRNELVCIVRNGLDGEVKVNGITFNQPMPANPGLSELDIAYVLTFITTTFGKTDSIYSHEEVRQALKDCK